MYSPDASELPETTLERAHTLQFCEYNYDNAKKETKDERGFRILPYTVQSRPLV